MILDNAWNKTEVSRSKFSYILEYAHTHTKGPNPDKLTKKLKKYSAIYSFIFEFLVKCNDLDL